jgi:hypothetical protein
MRRLEMSAFNVEISIKGLDGKEYLMVLSIYATDKSYFPCRIGWDIISMISKGQIN